MARTAIVGIVVFAFVAVLETAMILVGPASAQAQEDAVQRGEYLVSGGGCGDCHTPMAEGPSGPAYDRSRLLSGHPETLELTPPPALQPPWMAVVTSTMTAWAGPWGVSFSRNLTPDRTTGLGGWNQTTFVETIRNGRIMGKGRAILPPMPIEAIRHYSDSDLQAMFAYLQSIPALFNRVPDPMPPAAQAGE